MEKSIFFIGNSFSGEETLTSMLSLHPEIVVHQGTALAHLTWSSFDKEVEKNPEFDLKSKVEASLERQIVFSGEGDPREFWEGLFEGNPTVGGECAPQQTFPGTLHWFQKHVSTDILLVHCVKNPLHRAGLVSEEMTQLLESHSMDSGTELAGQYGRVFKGWLFFEQVAEACEILAPSVWVREEDLLVDPMKHVGRVLTKAGLSFPEDGEMGRGVQEMAKTAQLLSPKICLNESELPGPVNVFARRYGYFGPKVRACAASQW